MSHYDIKDRLNDYIDGALAPEAAREVEVHLDECATCRRELTRLRALLRKAATMPRSIDPPEDLWPRIEAVMGPPALGSRTLWSMRYPLTAAAAMLIMISSVITAVIVERRASADAPNQETTAAVGSQVSALMVRFHEIESAYLRAALELGEALDAAKSTLSPATVTMIEKNLRIIDAAIQESRAALALDPGNRELMQMLSATYMKKMDVLKQVTQLSE